MPSFKFDTSQLTMLVAYLRSMRDFDSSSVPIGDAGRGQSVFEGGGACPSEFTVNSDFHLAGEGTVPDFTSHFVEHLTINANCEVSVVFLHVSSDCK